MIAKHVAMHATRRSDFAGLVTYLISDQGKAERVGCVTVTHCCSNAAGVAILEVHNTQAQNRRATSDKTYHLIVSFHAGEQPPGAVLQAIETRLCDDLGFGAHQRVSAVHHDTDHLHLHIAVNKIHPTRYTLHDPYRDYRTLALACAALERDFGLEPDNHHATKCGAENRAADMERHTGIDSLLGWIRRTCLDGLQAAQSWPALHQILSANGLAVTPRGAGLVFTAAEGTTVKASAIDRTLSKGMLEARLGAFLPPCETQPSAPALRQYARQPVPTRVDTTALFAQYQTEQRQARDARSDALAHARARKTRRIDAAKRIGRLKRAAIKHIAAPGLTKKVLYAAASRNLKRALDRIHKTYLQERDTLGLPPARPTWADWLRDRALQHDLAALDALRARHAAPSLRGNTVQGRGARQPVGTLPKADSITKHGTIIYRVGAAVLRDNGVGIQVSEGADTQAVQAALQLAMTRYGCHLRIRGSTRFEDQIADVVAAAGLEVTFEGGGRNDSVACSPSRARHRVEDTHPLSPSRATKDQPGNQVAPSTARVTAPHASTLARGRR